MSRSRIYDHDLPPTNKGLTIGLYGGSFNPAHDGHRHVAMTALNRLQLDRIWCLVTPGNPLKDISELPSQVHRMAGTAKIMDHPRIDITGIEARARTRFTAESLDWIMNRTAGVKLVWIMGADNLQQFHLWQRWQSIMERIPVAIVDRPGYSLSSLSAQAAQYYSWARQPAHEVGALARKRCPAWSFLFGPRSALSSTALRQSAKTGKQRNQ